MKFSSFDKAISSAKELDKEKDWAGLATLSEEIAKQYPDRAEGWLLHALAKHRLGEHIVAIDSVERGLDRSPESNWGLNLAVAIYRILQRHSECRALVARLISLPSVTAENYETAAEYFAEIGEWSEASKYSLQRRNCLLSARSHASATTPRRERITLVVQAFARSDRIKGLLDSLELAHGHEACNLLICIDSAINSKNPEKYSTPNREVITSITERMPSLLVSYNSVTVSVNPVNLSTALTAQRACDFGFALSDNVVFFEEDCIVAPGAINWFKFGLTKIRSEGRYWFIGGESPFFDSKGKAVPPEVATAARKVATLDKVRKSYIEENYVPSTCFATTVDIWNQVRGVRGLPRGAEHISTFVSESGKRTIFPTVPFVKDVGMQDDLGYSVAKLGKAGVLEEKTVYLMNDATAETFALADFDTPTLYSATSNLELSVFDELNFLSDS
jgi:hypothetical protein